MSIVRITDEIRFADKLIPAVKKILTHALEDEETNGVLSPSRAESVVEALRQSRKDLFFRKIRQRLGKPLDFDIKDKGQGAFDAGRFQGGLHRLGEFVESAINASVSLTIGVKPIKDLDTIRWVEPRVFVVKGGPEHVRVAEDEVRSELDQVFTASAALSVNMPIRRRREGAREKSALGATFRQLDTYIAAKVKEDAESYEGVGGITYVFQIETTSSEDDPRYQSARKRRAYEEAIVDSIKEAISFRLIHKHKNFGWETVPKVEVITR